MSDAEIEALPEGVQEELFDLDPRYLFVMEYLARKELDLHPSRSELTWHQEQCILFVAGQRHKIREEMREGNDLDDESMQFRDEAAPDEMSMSDKDLLSVVRKRR
jgi:hypothetical protein